MFAYLDGIQCMFMVPGTVFYLGSKRSWFMTELNFGGEFAPPDTLIHVRSLPGEGPIAQQEITRAALSLLLCHGRTHGKKSGRCAVLLYCALARPGNFLTHYLHCSWGKIRAHSNKNPGSD